MLNFYGVNVTKGQEREGFAGDVFLTNVLTAEQEAELDAYLQATESLENRARLPLPLRIVKGVSWVIWIILLICIFGADVSFAQSYQNAPGFYWAGGICFVVWLTLYLLERRRMKQVASDPTTEAHFKNAETVAKTAMQILEIPDDAESMDVLADCYTLKDGVAKHKDCGLTQYQNFDQFVYVQHGCLCFSNLRQVWEIPLSSFRSMHLEKKRISFPEWHKQEGTNSDKYKPYKITPSQNGFFCKYYRIEISDVKGNFFLLLPEFEGELFSKLTHIHPDTTA